MGNAPANGGKRTGVTLIPQAHGGALLPGGQKGQTPGPGRPRESIRVTMREHLVTLIPRVLKDIEKHKITALQAAELFARYGLGTQTEAVTPEDMKDAATRIVNEVVTILLDEEHWPLEKVQAVAARITRAADHSPGD